VIVSLQTENSVSEEATNFNRSAEKVAVSSPSVRRLF
jgi:hypothetical protein